jgi:hypothetical protein
METKATINSNTASSTHARTHAHTPVNFGLFKTLLQPADYIGTKASELFISSGLNATAEA